MFDLNVYLTGIKPYFAKLGHYACPERLLYMSSWFVQDLLFHDDLYLSFLFDERKYVLNAST